MNRTDCFCYLIIMLFSIMLFVRNFYSFCWSDESYYLSSVYRIYQGDLINQEIWENIYFAYPLLVPFSIYVKFAGTEGVYLFFRHIQVFLFTCVGFKAYRTFRHYNRGIAVVISVCLMTYSRANIMGTSYYNMAFCFYMLASLCLFDSLFLTRNTHKAFGVLTGIFAGTAILFNPYILIPGFLLLIYTFYKNKNHSMYISAGSSAVDFVFSVAAFLSRNGSAS